MLKTLEYLVNFKKELLEAAEIQSVLESHKQKLQIQIDSKAGSEFNEYLKKELGLIQEVYKAPMKKMKSNFDKEELSGLIHVN